MTLELLPNIGFIIDSIILNWNEKREYVRDKLNNQHQEKDIIFEIPQLFAGDVNQNLHQKRDVYGNINGRENYFFLNYDQDDRLYELEIHGGIHVKINDVKVKFGEDINISVKQLKLKGNKCIELEEGNYLFEELKLTIANSESMGGNRNRISYFYYAQDIKHLI